MKSLRQNIRINSVFGIAHSILKFDMSIINRLIIRLESNNPLEWESLSRFCSGWRE